MRHYDILFDKAASQIHFTRSNCSEHYFLSKEDEEEYEK